MTNQPMVSGFEVDGQISTYQQAYLICKQLNWKRDFIDSNINEFKLNACQKFVKNKTIEYK